MTRNSQRCTCLESLWCCVSYHVTSQTVLFSHLDTVNYLHLFNYFYILNSVVLIISTMSWYVKLMPFIGCVLSCDITTSTSLKHAVIWLILHVVGINSQVVYSWRQWSWTHYYTNSVNMTFGVYSCIAWTKLGLISRPYVHVYIIIPVPEGPGILAINTVISLCTDYCCKVIH